MSDITEHVIVVKAQQSQLPGSGSTCTEVCDHGGNHQAGGRDTFNVTDMSGRLADEQYAGWIEDKEIDTTGLADGMVLMYQSSSDTWIVTLGAGGAHATTHTDGTDDIQDATTVQKGLMTIAQATKLDNIEAGAEVNNISDVNATDLTDGGVTTLHTHAAAAPAAHVTTHHSGGTDPLVHDSIAGAGSNTHAQIDSHIADVTTNPHAVDLANLGAGTLAQLNAVVTDATLDDSGDSRTPTAHDLGGAGHNADTLANLNTKVSDTTLQGIALQTVTGATDTLAALKSVVNLGYLDTAPITEFTLLAASAVSAGYKVTIKDTHKMAHINYCDVAPDGSDTIDDSTDDLRIETKGRSVDLVSDGVSNWSLT